jgi:hypothetical protein
MPFDGNHDNWGRPPPDEPPAPRYHMAETAWPVLIACIIAISGVVLLAIVVASEM